MAYTSSFTIYTSMDPQGPGQITGTTGSLITILDACLVNGYGTGSYYKAPAGWTKPLPNSGSVSASAYSYGCWQQGTGSKFTLFVNDNGPVVNNECWITGWETMSVLCTTTGSQNVGAGLAQFPLPAQSNTYGYMVWRKSNVVSTAGKNWIIAADAQTMYVWFHTEDDPNRYYHGMFGDCYSFRGADDLWNCCIYGRVANNSAIGQSANNGTIYDYTDVIPMNPSVNSAGCYLTVNQPGHYVARTAYGSGNSVGFTKRGDGGIEPYGTIWNNPSPHCTGIFGILQAPNGMDNSLYLAPLQVAESSTGVPIMRGRLRGLYQVGHWYANFADGQLFSGSAVTDYNGKAFMIVRYGYTGGFWALEISPTVETN